MRAASRAAVSSPAADLNPLPAPASTTRRTSWMRWTSSSASPCRQSSCRTRCSRPSAAPCGVTSAPPRWASDWPSRWCCGGEGAWGRPAVALGAPAPLRARRASSSATRGPPAGAGLQFPGHAHHRRGALHARLQARRAGRRGRARRGRCWRQEGPVAVQALAGGRGGGARRRARVWWRCVCLREREGNRCVCLRERENPRECQASGCCCVFPVRHLSVAVSWCRRWL